MQYDVIITNKLEVDILITLVHLDRVFTGMSIVVTNRTMFYSSQRKNRVFTAVVFRTIFYCIMSFVVTNWTMFLQECLSWLLIGPCFYSSHRENRVFTAVIDRTMFLH